MDVLTSRYHVFYTAVEAGIIIILALHALYQPYTNKLHNIIDTLLFADLALINAITLVHYRIFPLLSACTYISTERKPALNSEVRLTARCNMRLPTSRYACASAGIFKGACPVVQSFALHVAALRSAQNGAHCLTESL